MQVQQMGAGGDPEAGRELARDRRAAKRAAASSSSTDRPPRARYVAHTRPLWPPPTMMQS